MREEKKIYSKSTTKVNDENVPLDEKCRLRLRGKIRTLVYIKVCLVFFIGIQVCQTCSIFIVRPRFDLIADPNRQNDVLLLIIGLISLVYYIWFVIFLWTKRNLTKLVLLFVGQLIHLSFTIIYFLINYLRNTSSDQQQQASTRASQSGDELFNKYELVKFMMRTLSLTAYFLVDFICLGLFIFFMVKQFGFYRKHKTTWRMFDELKTLV